MRNPMTSLLAAVALAAMAGVGRAETSLKIGFVDFDRVVRESQSIKATVASISSEARRLQDKIDQNAGKYQRQAQLLEEQKSVLTKEQLEARKEELRALKSETEDLRYQMDKLLRDSKTDKLNPALEQAMKVVQRIGKAENYDLIVNGESVLFAAKPMDLTAKVIAEIDRETLGQPAQAPAVTPGQGKRPSLEK